MCKYIQLWFAMLVYERSAYFFQLSSSLQDAAQRKSGAK